MTTQQKLTKLTLTKLTDEELMSRYIAGDYNAFNIIYQRYSRKVYTYLCKRLHSRQHVNDVFQNIFIKLHKHRSRYDGKYPLMAWLYTISRCELLDSLKKRDTFLNPEDLHPEEKVEMFHSQPTAAQPTTATTTDSRHDINIDAERKLSMSERQVIKLRYFSELTFNQIAERLNLKPAAARKINSRGLRKLRLKYTGRPDA